MISPKSHAIWVIKTYRMNLSNVFKLYFLTWPSFGKIMWNKFLLVLINYLLANMLIWLIFFGTAVFTHNESNWKMNIVFSLHVPSRCNITYAS
jgi:hypothetical protein